MYLVLLAIRIIISFIATFCHQLTRNERPKIEVDGVVKLIYVGDLVNIIIDKIRSGSGNSLFSIAHTDERSVSDILSLLEGYKNDYMDAGVIPLLGNIFEVNLFNTFRCYMDIKKYFPRKFTKHTDPRGAFVEVIRLNVGGQVSFFYNCTGYHQG